jgi:hypothetical protein
MASLSGLGPLGPVAYHKEWSRPAVQHCPFAELLEADSFSAILAITRILTYGLTCSACAFGALLHSRKEWRQASGTALAY